MATIWIHLKVESEYFEIGGRYVGLRRWRLSEVDRGCFAGDVFSWASSEDWLIDCSAEKLGNPVRYNPEARHLFLAFVHGVLADTVAAFQAPKGSSGDRILLSVVAAEEEMRSCIVADLDPTFAVEYGVLAEGSRAGGEICSVFETQIRVD